MLEARVIWTPMTVGSRRTRSAEYINIALRRACGILHVQHKLSRPYKPMKYKEMSFFWMTERRLCGTILELGAIS